MPSKKWQSSSGASKNRILGATRLKSEGQTIFPVTLNDNSSNGFALNVQGSNLVLGLGTSEPFSRLSMGNNTDSGIFAANDTGRLASLALKPRESRASMACLAFGFESCFTPLGFAVLPESSTLISRSFNSTISFRAVFLPIPGVFASKSESSVEMHSTKE